jgi:type II secretory pathway predicted ATPase ExeA
MYYEYFGLKQPPFRITPDTRLFYPGGNRGAVLEALVYAIGNGEGIVKVVGEVGSGKTMLCRMLEQELPDNIEVVYLANPSLSPEVILHAIAHELKLPQAAGTPRIQVMNALHEHLLRRHAEGRQVVVFVEEAQGMPLETLEEVRLLSNLETGSSKLLQIVLFGQPELDEHMARREIRQLKERITYSFQLGPFNREHIAEYLNSRVRACGYRSGELFAPAAIRVIGKFSDGLVRRINILADKSLLAAYADNSHTVLARHVQRAARDSEFVSRAAFWRNRIIAAVVLVVLLAGAGLWWGLSSFDRSADSGSPVAAVDPQPSPAVPAAPEPVAVRPQQAPATEPPTAMPGPSDTSAAEPPVQESVPVALPESGAAEPAAADAPVVEPVEAETAVPPRAEPGDSTALLGMGPVFNWQDGGDPRLTTRELTLLQQQLQTLPPEEAAELGSVTGTSGGCELCWSIIYRPLPPSENL